MASFRRFSGTAGNLGTPGAPIMHFELVIYRGPPIEGGHPADSVSGHVEIEQAVLHPHPLATNVTGHAYTIGGKEILAFHGQAAESFPPPAIGETAVPITGLFVLESAEGGHGSFTFGKTHISDVKVVLTH